MFRSYTNILLFEWVVAMLMLNQIKAQVKRSFLIFSSDIFIEWVLETEGSFKALPESLKEIRVGVLGACRGSLGPDWSNFLCQGAKGEHRNVEREMNKRGNDQRVRDS